MAKNNPFSFEISLSVLNHLGRNLYRSFNTVLGEAVSNSWDADAKNVWIYVDKEKDSLIIKDDGDGMNTNDFQNKFLKIGYSKRKDGALRSKRDRPFIGRKGIGKLALLSCADKITVISKKIRGEYIGGTIENSRLDKAITEDLTPQQYLLGNYDMRVFAKYIRGHKKGTIIYFKNIKGGIKNNLDFLRKIVALYFRFSLVDKTFNIFIDDKKVTLEDLKDLAEKTEFLWKINNINDPYIKTQLKKVKERKELTLKGSFNGFIASVGKPRDLSIMNLDERVGVDLFVNGRLRENNILKHIPTARIVEDYIYGQIHFNDLDDGSIDRFTTAREGVISEDPKYQKFLSDLRDKILKSVTEDWDKWRVKHREDGDSENPRMSRKARKSAELFNAVSEEFSPPVGAKNKSKVDSWVAGLSVDARFNFSSYAECFISENLIRKFIVDKNIPLSNEAQKEIARWKKKEGENKGKGNISISIRKGQSDLSYLAMDDLAYLVDSTKGNPKTAGLSRDADEYKPVRDALAHTALLTEVAKAKLTSVYENIKGRINKLLK